MRTLIIKFLQSVLIFLLILTFSNESLAGIGRQKSDPDSAIRKSLYRLNEMCATKDVQKMMSLFDDSEDIIVVGSDSGEVFIGKKQVQSFMSFLCKMPFVFSFDLNMVSINHNKNTAWVFVDGKMVHTKGNIITARIPYRITAVMVKRGSDWKWKIFSGSIPRGE